MKTISSITCIIIVLAMCSFISFSGNNNRKNIPSNHLVVQADSNCYQCDTLYTAKGDVRLVQFVKAYGKVVEYKSCYNLDGPVYVISANKVQCVKSADGTMKFTRLAPGEKPRFAAPE
jgi:hypothetical protein